ncbi:succinate CoA transferase [Cetobacterium sp.]|uniref:succinate CoA transferase n=1 Tax=Cetobacterium sp. TaxID=2071632 RepID=UPI003AEFB597
MDERILCKKLKDKIMLPEEALKFIKPSMVIATSGFTPSGYPKAIPLALKNKIEKTGEKFELTLITGASVGDELDGALSRVGAIAKRYAYQTNDAIRNSINSGKIKYQDMHLSHVGQWLNYGFFGKIDIAIIEACMITENGGIVPTTSVGISPQAIKNADMVIVEINTTQPLELKGCHDIYMVKNPPNREPIPLKNPEDRIGTYYIPCDSEKIVAIVKCDIPDKTRDLVPEDEDSKKISQHIIKFFESEVEQGRLPKNLFPLQSGVGSVANAIFKGLVESQFENLSCYTEVIQDSMLDLIDAGKIRIISGTSFTPSEKGLKRLLDNIEHYTKYCILRPQEISNNPILARQLGVISMNTAIEVDIYGHVNSSMIMGSKMMNGIGGSGDFTRNAYISIFTTVSTAKKGLVSSIVPMVSHVDHTEHDVQIVVTEQGLADLRGLSAKERALSIINNCAHPDYKKQLLDYLERATSKTGGHEPHIIHEALSWHDKFIKTGSMK